MAFTARGRRLACLLSLLAATIVPVMLQMFFLADTSPHVASILEHRLGSLEADDFQSNPVDWDKFQESSLPKGDLTANEYQRILYDLLMTRRNDGRLDLTSSRVISETFQLEKDRKKSIDAMVTILIAFAVPIMAFVYAFLFLRTPKGVPWTKQQQQQQRLRRKDRILRDLVACRIPLLPKTTNAENPEDAPRDCPICLSAFTPGEVVIAPKYCHCSIHTASSSTSSSTTTRTTTNKNGASDKVAPADDPSMKKNDIQPNYNTNHRRMTTTCCFHEGCILEWLSQRKTNPKKLCPCCRQPFFGSST